MEDICLGRRAGQPYKTGSASQAANPERFGGVLVVSQAPRRKRPDLPVARFGSRGGSADDDRRPASIY